MSSPIGVNKLKLVMRKRDGVLFTGEVYALSSTNEIGDFDILPYHANYVCTLKEYVTVHLDGGFKKEFPVERGVLRVEDNKAEIYIGL